MGKLIQSCSKYKRLVYLRAQRQSQPRRAFSPYVPSSVQHKTRRCTNGGCESHCSPSVNICRPLKAEILMRTAASLYPSSTKPSVLSSSWLELILWAGRNTARFKRVCDRLFLQQHKHTAQSAGVTEVVTHA